MAEARHPDVDYIPRFMLPDVGGRQNLMKDSYLSLLKFQTKVSKRLDHDSFLVVDKTRRQLSGSVRLDTGLGLQD